MKTSVFTIANVNVICPQSMDTELQMRNEFQLFKHEKRKRKWRKE